MDAKAEKIALFRYGLIAPLVLEALPRGELTRRAEEIAARQYEIPGSQRTSISVDTLLDWALRLAGIEVREGSRLSGCPRPMRRSWLRRKSAINLRHGDAVPEGSFFPANIFCFSPTDCVLPGAINPKAPFSLVKPPSGGLGLQDAKIARLVLPGAPL